MTVCRWKRRHLSEYGTRGVEWITVLYVYPLYKPPTVPDFPNTDLVARSSGGEEVSSVSSFVPPSVN